MKLIVEIKLRDDKVKKHECVDFPLYSGDFITLYKKGFIHERIRTETVLSTKHYFIK